MGRCNLYRGRELSTLDLMDPKLMDSRCTKTKSVRKRKKKRKKRGGGGGEVRFFALTSNPGVIKLIRGIGKELYCRLMGVLASGLLVTWTKSSSVRQKVRKGGSQSVRQFPSPSSSSLCAVRHEGCGGLRFDPHTEYRGGGGGGRGVTSC